MLPSTPAWKSRALRCARLLLAPCVLWGWTTGNAVGAEQAVAGPAVSPSAESNTAAIGPEAVFPGRLPPHALLEQGGAHATPLEVDIEQLKRDRAAMIDVRNSVAHEPSKEIAAISGERDKLKRQLQEVIVELARRPKPEKTPAAPDPKQERKARVQARVAKATRENRPGATGLRAKSAELQQPVSASGPVDSMGLALALFRTGDYNGALKAFELAKKTATDPHDRVVIRYLSAACLRKLGNTAESTTLFREVANSKTDELLAECAKWQLSSQQWCDSTKARIAQLRAVQASDKVASATPTAANGGSKSASR